MRATRTSPNSRRHGAGPDGRPEAAKPGEEAEPMHPPDYEDPRKAALAAALREDAATGGKLWDQVFRQFVAQVVDEVWGEDIAARTSIRLLDNPDRVVDAETVKTQIRAWIAEHPEAADRYLAGRAMLVATAQADPVAWNYAAADLEFLWDRLWIENHPRSGGAT